MHVVHLYDGHEQVYDGKGSVPEVVWNVARETAARGHDVTVVERRWDGLERRATHEGVDFRRLALWTGADEPWTRVPYELVASPASMLRLIGDRTWFAARALWELKRLDVDVLHVHLPLAANVLLTVAPWLQRRTVYTAHLGELRLNALRENGGAAADEVDVPSVVRRFSPDVYLAERAAATTALNESIRDAFVDRGVPASRVAVVPNGVDVDRFGEVAEERVRAVGETYGLDGVRTVLFVGTVVPRKGVTDLVEAMADVVETVDGDVRLVIAGETELDGEYTARVRSLVEKHDLGGVVEFAGFVPDDELPALYAAADVLALPSHEEGFGMTAVEAMAAGTPVVATRVGGLPDIVADGEQGRLVPTGEHVRFAATLADVLDDPESGASMAAAARERAEAFSWAGVADRVESVYERVVKP